MVKKRKKIYVLDTSVILYSHDSIMNFEENEKAMDLEMVCYNINNNRNIQSFSDHIIDLVHNLMEQNDTQSSNTNSSEFSVPVFFQIPSTSV